MLIYVIAICELVAFLIALCVIAQQRDIIKRQGWRLLEALDRLEPEELVREDWDEL